MRTLFVAMLLGCLCFQSTAQSPLAPGSYHGPVHAELLKYFHVRHVRAGSPVFVRVTENWSAFGCSLRQGAIIEGRVESASPREAGNKISQLAISFSKAQCSGAEMAPIKLVLAAVCWIPETKNVVPVVRVADLHNGGIAASIGFLETSTQAPRPKLQPGQVYGIRGLKLEVGGGPERSSLLSATNHDVSLERKTEFLLVPFSVAFLPTPVSLSSSDFAAAISDAEASTPFTLPSLSPISDEFAPCSPPFCSTDLPLANNQVSGHPSKSIPILPLGYSPRPRKEVMQLDDDEEVAWLGANRLLLAFNQHKLIHRSQSADTAGPVRTIHAVLLDIDEGRVLGTADWDLPDSGKFLWQLSRNRLLIHTGNELCVYDATLTLVSRLPLDGPLKFARISPSGDFISIGTLHERHSAELHKQLFDSLDRAPEEDVNMVVLDKDFKIVASAVAASDIVPPVLMDEGQLRLLSRPDRHYRLSLMTWENQELTVARFSSGCPPEVSAFPPDLVSISSCDKANGTMEFRVLRSDGQMVTHRKPDPQELGHAADGNSSSQTFAVRTMRTASAVHAGSTFHGADLLSEEVRICRATDGKTLASVRAEAPAPSQGGYALSPDGSRLAVIADAHLNIYSVPTN